MNSATEIRKLPPSNLRELYQMLELNESWKKLMAIIPKVLQKNYYHCDITRNNLHRYHSEHFKLIENNSITTHRSCTEILFDEWGTSGRVRPALGHLLHLLVKAELYRAADYVAVTLLNIKPPARPNEGPAAVVTTILPDARLEEIEKVLDQINYPSSVIEDLKSNSHDVNVNYSSADNNNVPVIPKIVVSEIPDANRNSFASPTILENRRKLINRQDASIVDDSVNTTVSDMIKFSQSEICSSSDNVSSDHSSTLPNISILNNSHSDDSQTQSLKSLPDDNANLDSLPALSALNITSDVLEIQTQNVPALSELLDENVPHITKLLENNIESNIMTSKAVPNLTMLISDQQLNDKKTPVVTINVIKSDESTSLVPQFSALLSAKRLPAGLDSKHFLPITDHTSDVSSETSSYSSSKNSNISSEFSQNSNISHRSNLSNSSPSRPVCTSPLPNLSLNTQLPHFTYYEIEQATNNFDQTPHKNCQQVENPLVKTNGRFLGSGAFGSVFLALDVIDKPVAVKKLFLNNMDIVNVDDPITKQFKNEVEVLSKYKHENLLSLVGYSCDGPTYCLLYEFVPGGALKDRLQNVDDKIMWTDRLYIALGTARAISYLHTAYNTPLIHRDIKTANILLDCTNKPKLCDFGLIKLIPNQNTNTSTSAFGTSAYMAREAFRGDVSVKLDSYSFGVVLLELITSLPPLDENREGCDIVTHVEEVCENEDITPLIDAKAGSWIAKDINFAAELYNIANKCLEQNKKKRPTMVEVTEALAVLIKNCS